MGIRLDKTNDMGTGRKKEKGTTENNMAKSGGELKNEKRRTGAHGMTCGLQQWRQSVKALCASGHRRTGNRPNYKKT